MSTPGRWRRIARSAGLFLLLAPALGHAENRDVLWNLVGLQCVPEARQGIAPKPCASVDLARGMAVLKDRDGIAQYLVIPTDRVTGIEDPAVLINDNGFAVAWETRPAVEAKLGHPLPRDGVSLAVNSRNGRTQDQLHIHVDCLDAAVRATLATTPATAANWAPYPAPLAGHHYLARFVPGETLQGVNPFRLLADQVHGPIGDWTLVAVGATTPDGRPGFLLLAQNDAHASGEQLQDHTCHGY
jgi:CDP-diacylglycerol pyrophosphatase